jgi:hypothetical protein
MRVFVTGGRGFLARVVTSHLIDSGAQVTLLSRGKDWVKVDLQRALGRPRGRPTGCWPSPDPTHRALGRQGLLLPRQPRPAAPQADQDRHPSARHQIVYRQRRGSAGGRPPDFEAETYKRRNVIERSFHDHKQSRGLATRYDKLATTYRGGVVLRAIVIWLRQ